MESESAIVSEVKSWLKIILSKDNLRDLSVSVLGNSEKGDGYVGDIVFVYASGITQDGSIKKYDLVLKCSKRSQALREKTPVKAAFMSEIYIYDTVLPSFIQFQIEKGIEDPFNSIPKCYGTFTGENMEVIVFDNLKKSGYDLWDKKKPLTRKHVDMVINEYGKLHAVSLAMRDQQSKKFEEFVVGLGNVFKEFVEAGDMENVFGSCIEEIYDLLKGELDERTLLKWKDFRKQVNYVFNDMLEEVDGVKVILHGDCWNNNFMFQSDNEGSPLKVAILDWQISRFSSPIFDLSYFLFACVSKDDLQDLDIVLETYYKSLSNNLVELGSDVDELYPFNQFLDDWKKYSRFGILMATLILKICSTAKDEVMDLAQVVDAGKDFSNTFLYEIKDKTTLKNRMAHIVKYVVENELI